MQSNVVHVFSNFFNICDILKIHLFIWRPILTGTIYCLSNHLATATAECYQFCASTHSTVSTVILVICLKTWEGENIIDIQKSFRRLI